MEERLAVIPVEDRQLVTNHHVFTYLAERFDFEVVATVVPSGTTLASTSAADRPRSPWVVTATSGSRGRPTGARTVRWTTHYRTLDAESEPGTAPKVSN